MQNRKRDTDVQNRFLDSVREGQNNHFISLYLSREGVKMWEGGISAGFEY